MNILSHREQHREVRHNVIATFATIGHKPSADDYRVIRHDVARQRREEQRQARIAAGTDRSIARTARLAPKTSRAYCRFCGKRVRVTHHTSGGRSWTWCRKQHVVQIAA